MSLWSVHLFLSLFDCFSFQELSKLIVRSKVKVPAAIRRTDGQDSRGVPLLPMRLFQPSFNWKGKRNQGSKLVVQQKKKKKKSVPSQWDRQAAREKRSFPSWIYVTSHLPPPSYEASCYRYLFILLSDLFFFLSLSFQSSFCAPFSPTSADLVLFESQLRTTKNYFYFTHKFLISHSHAFIYVGAKNT